MISPNGTLLDDQIEDDIKPVNLPPLTAGQLALALNLPLPTVTAQEKAKHFDMIKRIAGSLPSWRR